MLKSTVRISELTLLTKIVNDLRQYLAVAVSVRHEGDLRTVSGPGRPSPTAVVVSESGLSRPVGILDVYLPDILGCVAD